MDQQGKRTFNRDYCGGRKRASEGRSLHVRGRKRKKGKAVTKQNNMILDEGRPGDNDRMGGTPFNSNMAKGREGNLEKRDRGGWVLEEKL